MIIVDCLQQSEEWFSARLGVPSASRFDCIVTPTGKPVKGAARHRYLCELAGERLTKTVQMHFTTDAMERGVKLEPRARAWYEMEYDVSVRQIGFAFGDDSRRWGASPDGIVDGVNGLEVKCPLRSNMIAMLLDDAAPSDYLMQVQGGMWVTGLPAWDLLVYTEDHGMPNRVWRIERNADIQDALAEHVPQFCKEVEDAVARLRELRGDKEGDEVAGMPKGYMP